MPVKISALPGASPLTGDESFPLVQSGVTKRAALNMIPGGASGTDTQLQYNKAGVFGADANLTWSYVLQNLSITGSSGNQPLSLLNSDSTTGTRCEVAGPSNESTGDLNGLSFLGTDTAGNTIEAKILQSQSSLVPNTCAGYFFASAAVPNLYVFLCGCDSAGGGSAAIFRTQFPSQEVSICDGLNAITYTAAAPGNWAGGVPPTDVWVALDRLAAALTLAGFPP
jgi:hypothetical protein